MPSHDVDSLECKGPGEINRPKTFCMLQRLLLEELAIFALCDDFHRVILDRWLVEFMPECFAYDGAP
jgi:hypothetical protein